MHKTCLINPYMMQTFSKLGTEGNFFNLIRTIYKKYTNSILNGEKLKVFPLKSGTR